MRASLEGRLVRKKLEVGFKAFEPWSAPGVIFDPSVLLVRNSLAIVHFFFLQYSPVCPI